MQFIEWYWKLEYMQGSLPNFEADAEIEATMTTAIFEVKSVPLPYIRAHGNYQNDLRL